MVDLLDVPLQVHGPTEPPPALGQGALEGPCVRTHMRLQGVDRGGEGGRAGETREKECVRGSDWVRR